MQAGVAEEHRGEGVTVTHDYMSQVIRVFPRRMDAWLPSGWSVKQELVFVVQGPRVVHGRAEKNIAYFNPLIFSVKNVFPLNDMQQVHECLEKVSLRPVECEVTVEKLCSVH